MHAPTTHLEAGRAGRRTGRLLRAASAVLILCATLAVAPVAFVGRAPAPLLPNGTFDRNLDGWTLSEPQAYCGGTQNIVVAKSRTQKPNP